MRKTLLLASSHRSPGVKPHSESTRVTVSSWPKRKFNKAGGLLGGRKIKIIMEDDQSKPGQPSAAVKKLVASDRAIAILGEIASSRSLEAAPICQNAKIPMVSPGSTNPSVTEKGDCIFRVCFIDPLQGTVMAKFALDNLHEKGSPFCRM
jgi:branched-chain amino acid transport system substrate-binding protein